MLDSLSYVIMCLDLYDNLGLLGEFCRVVVIGGCLGWIILFQLFIVIDRSKLNLVDVLMVLKVKKLIVIQCNYLLVYVFVIICSNFLEICLCIYSYVLCRILIIF